MRASQESPFPRAPVGGDPAAPRAGGEGVVPRHSDTTLKEMPGVPTMTDEECDLFRQYVQTHCAISLGTEKKYLFESRLARLLKESGAADFSEFYRQVALRADPQLRDRIVEAITTNETLWFRDGHPFVALRERVLPELAARARREQRRVRIWSAGCSTGQEPFSVAMLVDEMCQNANGAICFPHDFEIVATDISELALGLARIGRYDPVSMRRGMGGQWERYRSQYFDESGRTSQLDAALRRRVSFHRFNLQDDFRPFGTFDLILMRYVAIYFSREFRTALLGRLVGRLTPGGRLLLGAAEGLIDAPIGLVPERVGGSHFYRRGTQP
jgi:chemotaxis protein methyltransferase CheR